MLYTDKQKQIILNFLTDRLKESVDDGVEDRGVPLWLNILFLLDKVRDPHFSGIVTVKIDRGFTCGARVSEQVPPLEGIYKDILERVDQEEDVPLEKWVEVDPSHYRRPNPDLVLDIPDDLIVVSGVLGSGSIKGINYVSSGYSKEEVRCD